MKLKLDKAGHAVLKGGQPVYIHDDGREVAFDAASAMRMLLEERFARSSYVADNLTLPYDVAASGFGKNFRLEDGQLVPYDKNGLKILSRKNIGEVADFDEALKIVVSQYPDKDKILKKAAPAGEGSKDKGGTNDAGQGGGKGGKTVKRAAFERMEPAAQSAHIKSGGKVVD